MDGVIRSYRDLIIWQRAKQHASLIYQSTEAFPQHELYGLVSQMRRASVSIPSNIAEGFRRRSVKEKLQFMRIAYGSGAELETQLEIAFDLHYFNEKVHEKLANDLDEMMRMMNKAINNLERKA